MAASIICWTTPSQFPPLALVHFLSPPPPLPSLALLIAFLLNLTLVQHSPPRTRLAANESLMATLHGANWSLKGLFRPTPTFAVSGINMGFASLIILSCPSDTIFLNFRFTIPEVNIHFRPLLFIKWGSPPKTLIWKTRWINGNVVWRAIDRLIRLLHWWLGMINNWAVARILLASSPVCTRFWCNRCS